MPDFSIIWKYSHRPARPRAAINRKKTTSFPVHTTARAIAHIATALTSLRKKRLMKERCGGPCHIGPPASREVCRAFPFGMTGLSQDFNLYALKEGAPGVSCCPEGAKGLGLGF